MILLVNQGFEDPALKDLKFLQRTVCRKDKRKFRKYTNHQNSKHQPKKKILAIFHLKHGPKMAETVPSSI